jgi:putative ABC transport system permease protein
MHSSLTINAKARAGLFDTAQDQAQLVLRARRHLSGKMENDFFIGTKESYMALWRSISGAFFGVFILVSAISVVIGGIVIMNVMLVSVTLRKREIGARSALPSVTFCANSFPKARFSAWLVESSVSDLDSS